MRDLTELRQAIRQFAAERDWEQYHSPKNLAMALSVEAAELLEHFQWLTEAQSQALDADTLSRVRDEIADVQVYLVRIADQLNVDILQAVADKMQQNQRKYPADKVRGSAQKYTAYSDHDDTQSPGKV